MYVFIYFMDTWANTSLDFFPLLTYTMRCAASTCACRSGRSARRRDLVEGDVFTSKGSLCLPGTWFNYRSGYTRQYWHRIYTIDPHAK